METYYIIIILVCTVLSAYFSATETAFNTFNRIRMKGLAEKGKKSAALALKLSDKYDALISTILIGNNIVNIFASSIGTLVVGLLLAKAIANPSDSLVSTVSTAAITILILTFGEIVPKTLAKQFPDKFVMFSAPFINVLLYILFPISIIFRGLQKLLFLIFKKGEEKGMTEDELISIVEEAEEGGGIDEDESTLIKSAIEFNELEVGEIFTPRIDITAVPKDISKTELAKVFSESGYSRLPVYDGDLDNIVGMVYYKDFFTLSFKEATPISEILKPVIFVTKTQKINDLLKDLQEKQLHLAIVSDEYGSTAGIVTLEDVLEEIVGEIWDEHDEIIEEIKEVSEGEYIVSGKANLDKLLEELDIDMPEDDEENSSDATTVNGWAMDILGKVPEEGDVFETLGLTVKVLKMDGRRIENLSIVDNRESESNENVEISEEKE